MDAKTRYITSVRGYCGPEYSPYPFEPQISFNPNYILYTDNQEVYELNHRLNQISSNHFSENPIYNPLKYNLCLNHPPNVTGKRVLVFIHGFNTSAKNARSSLLKLAKKTIGTYDVVIGYSYPSASLSSGINSYQGGRALAIKAAKPFAVELKGILSQAERVDIVAHSMGAFLALNALNFDSLKNKKIGNLFLAGGAIGTDSLSVCEVSTSYRRALNNVTTIYNIFSCSDKVLQLHTLFIGERAVGRPNPLPTKCQSLNVKWIDSSKIINSHSAFLDNCHVIDFLQKCASWSDSNLSLKGKYFILDKCGNLRETNNQPYCQAPGDNLASNFRRAVTSVNNAVNDLLVLFIL